MLMSKLILIETKFYAIGNPISNNLVDDGPFHLILPLTDMEIVRRTTSGFFFITGVLPPKEFSVARFIGLH